MAGYVRQSETEIQDDEFIMAVDLNNEFDAIEAAFHQTTGHVHDGTTGGGAPISYTDLTNTPTLGNASSLNIGTTAGTVAAGDDSRIVNSVPNTLTISAGTGLTGGGDLTTNRTISLDSSSVASLALADTAVQPGDLATVATTGEAEDVSYTNTTSGLIATDVQTAIDELKARTGVVQLYPQTSLTGLTSFDIVGLDDYENIEVHIQTASGQSTNIRFRLGLNGVFNAGATAYIAAAHGNIGAGYDGGYLTWTAAQFRVQAKFTQLHDSNTYARVAGCSFNNSTAGATYYVNEMFSSGEYNQIRLFRADNSSFPATSFSVWANRRMGL